MTEEITYCIRGCVRPCDCTECAAKDVPVHPPIQREARDGLLCSRCADRIREWLREIPELYATLDVAAKRQAEDTGVGKGKDQKLSGSPALARLDIVTLQDPRTSATSKPDRTTGVMEPWDGSMYIPGEIGTWAILLAEEQHIRGRFDTLVESAGLLLRWMDRLCASLWVDECYDALRDVMRLLRAAHGEQRVRPVGKCINVYERDGEMVACEAVLYAPAEGVKIRCRSCGTRYDGQRMLLVKRQAKADQEAAG